MKKQIVLRSVLGFPLGVFIGHTISVIISLLIGAGQYLSAEPSLIASVGSEINAVILQDLLSGLLGVGFAASSIIWENEHWSLLKRTTLHLIAASLLMFPIAYLTHWMPHSLTGFVTYFLIFVGIYAGIWAAQYFSWMRKVRSINRRLQKK